MDIKAIAQELYRNMKSYIEVKSRLLKQKTLTHSDYTVAGYSIRTSEKLLEQLNDKKIFNLLRELEEVQKKEIEQITPIKNVNSRLFNKDLKLINSACFDAMVLCSNALHKHIDTNTTKN